MSPGARDAGRALNRRCLKRRQVVLRNTSEACNMNRIQISTYSQARFDDQWCVSCTCAAKTAFTVRPSADAFEFIGSGEYRNAVAFSGVAGDASVTSDAYAGSWEDKAIRCAVPWAMRATVEAERLGNLSACQKSWAKPSASLRMPKRNNRQKYLFDAELSVCLAVYMM